MGWIRSALKRRALDLVERGRWKPARRVAARLVKTDPDDGDARFLEVLALHALADHARVLAAADRARQRLPEREMPGIAFLAAQSAFDLGRNNEAARWVRLAERDPEFAERVRQDAQMSQAHQDVAFQ